MSRKTLCIQPNVHHGYGQPQTDIFLFFSGNSGVSGLVYSRKFGCVDFFGGASAAGPTSGHIYEVVIDCIYFFDVVLGCLLSLVSHVCFAGSVQLVFPLRCCACLCVSHARTFVW